MAVYVGEGFPQPVEAALGFGGLGAEHPHPLAVQDDEAVQFPPGQCFSQLQEIRIPDDVEGILVPQEAYQLVVLVVADPVQVGG